MRSPRLQAAAEPQAPTAPAAAQPALKARSKKAKAQHSSAACPLPQHLWAPVMQLLPHQCVLFLVQHLWTLLLLLLNQAERRPERPTMAAGRGGA